MYILLAQRRLIFLEKWKKKWRADCVVFFNKRKAKMWWALVGSLPALSAKGIPRSEPSWCGREDCDAHMYCSTGDDEVNLIWWYRTTRWHWTETWGTGVNILVSLTLSLNIILYNSNRVAHLCVWYSARRVGYKIVVCLYVCLFIMQNWQHLPQYRT